MIKEVIKKFNAKDDVRTDEGGEGINYANKEKNRHERK